MLLGSETIRVQFRKNIEWKQIIESLFDIFLKIFYNNKAMNSKIIGVEVSTPIYIYLLI